MEFKNSVANRMNLHRSEYIDSLAVSVTATDRHYYLCDANYNVTAAITPSAGVAERYSYSPYGKVTIRDADFSADADGNSDIGNEYLFTGRRLDAETGFYYFRNRYYSAEMGRFVTVDPIRYNGSKWNLYGAYFVPGGVDPLGYAAIHVSGEIWDYDTNWLIGIPILGGGDDYVGAIGIDIEVYMSKDGCAIIGFDPADSSANIGGISLSQEVRIKKLGSTKINCNGKTCEQPCYQITIQIHITSPEIEVEEYDTTAVSVGAGGTASAGSVEISPKPDSTKVTQTGTSGHLGANGVWVWGTKLKYKKPPGKVSANMRFLVCPAGKSTYDISRVQINNPHSDASHSVELGSDIANSDIYIHEFQVK